MENSLIWLMNKFGEDIILAIKTLTPTPNDFPIHFDGTQQVGFDLLTIVSKQMDLDLQEISLAFYDQGLFEYRGEMGLTMVGQQYEDENYSSGVYSGVNSEGKFSISIEVGQLKEPDRLIATLAHELAHVKILGKGLLKENDEYLTDLVTVFYGLGVFNANAAFQFYKNQERWGYKRQGYLIQQEWGYALALYAYIRRENDPQWVKFLTGNIRSDYRNAVLYIMQNMDKVLC